MDKFPILLHRLTKFRNGLSANSSTYYPKNEHQYEIEISFADNSTVSMSSSLTPDLQKKIKKFIGRSSIRIIPRISNQGNIDSLIENLDGPGSFIEADTRFNNDLSTYMQQIDNALREPVFSGKSADTLKIFQDFILPLNTSLINIFGGDATTTIQISEYQNATAQANGKLIFKKGDSKINYDLLSHGEKR